MNNQGKLTRCEFALLLTMYCEETELGSEFTSISDSTPLGIMTEDLMEKGYISKGYVIGNGVRVDEAECKLTPEGYEIARDAFIEGYKTIFNGGGFQLR